jgi:HK97 family phage prohead protease
MFCEKKISATMRERKRLNFTLQLKSLDGEGRFAGYASVFDMLDNQRDIITKGAFYNTLKKPVHQIKLLWQHQQEEPIGIFDRIFEDAHGLYVEGRLLLGVRRAAEAYALLKSGAISGLSIGYSPVRYRIDSESGIRKLSEVELWEISLVTFPANSAANVTVVKQIGYEPNSQFMVLSQALNRAIAVLQ